MSERAYGRAAMPEKNTITTDTFQSLLVPSQAVMCTTASSVSAPPGAPPQWPHNSGYMAVIVRAQPYIQSQSYCSHALVTHRSQTCIRLVAAVHVSSILLSSESSVIPIFCHPSFCHPILLSSHSSFIHPSVTPPPQRGPTPFLTINFPNHHSYTHHLITSRSPCHGHHSLDSSV